VPLHSSTPTPALSAKKVKVTQENVTQARELSIQACTTPVEFVNQFVYDGVQAEVLQFATQLPDTWSNLVSNNKLRDLIGSRRQLAESSIAFWRRLFPVAMGIAVSMVGIKFTTLGLENYGVNPDDKRSFWFMCLVMAALNTSAMGPGRPLARNVTDGAEAGKEYQRLTVYLHCPCQCDRFFSSATYPCLYASHCLLCTSHRMFAITPLPIDFTPF
jgi:hypothetical protein